MILRSVKACSLEGVKSFCIYFWAGFLPFWFVCVSSGILKSLILGGVKARGQRVVVKAI